ncbi:hypothetical protein BM86_32855 [Bacillus thuringiensis]|uniref:hypothetical protein n=1 Tax=Bacillus thuringiensis TaxID=1428 RepID=UPI00080B6AAF|nr:hypothetical protein [Bacillus thuringiensis]MBH0340116.1 hypothetical protein [Bacillus thuringiensis]
MKDHFQIVSIFAPEPIQEGKIQLIQGMHKNGMDIEDIAKFTNMDISEVRNILLFDYSEK